MTNSQPEYERGSEGQSHICIWCTIGKNKRRAQQKIVVLWTDSEVDTDTFFG